MFQSIEVSPTIQADSKCRDLIDRGTRLLEEIVGDDFTPTVRLAWETEKDQSGGNVIYLTMGDDKGQVRSAFPPDEFRRTDQLKDHFASQFARLLHNRTRTLLRELRERNSGEEKA